ncbi:disintegrin and metalloproteinase domain-containing protein 18-like isoform X1 [Erinaceus europaeus]|uniref:Disintegrin and metalloproteinase domain-containing protein 18-like isoform X1 n=1 Tax=Erinaceus europaeus TaxID=9365 RepID=A0ABM3WNS9_ERIEU|nr:disintegrin and metalloproteinase domain-containing protein 18-like isoform X1 [Erinaceus europaeus]
MFFLLALLTELGELSSHLRAEEILLHVTVPQKLWSNKSEDSGKQVTYMITVDEKPYTLHLKKHTFLPQNFLVYIYDETGYLHVEPLSFKIFCHYQGYIANFPNSAATLDICTGLRGFLQFGNVSYGIEPLESSTKFEHIIYQVNNVNADIPMQVSNYSSIWQEDHPSKVILSSQKKSISKLLPQELRIHIIVEKAFYDHMGSEKMAVTQKIIQIIALVNSLFAQFKLTVVLSSLELWSNNNQISTNGDADNLLQRFVAWKNSYLILQPYDIALLLTYRKQPKYVGATFPGTICNKTYGADVAVYSDAVTLEGFSVTIAQILSLKIGLKYDSSKCICPGATCIMNHKAMYFSGMKIFSNCSMDDYRYFASKLADGCLWNSPNIQSRDQNQPVCGNGILEPGEECDCGSEEECTFKMCCDYSTCRLKGSVECGSGPCCTSTCELSKAGTPCRKSVDEECDFTEYCNGTSSSCVPDTYVLNGKLCGLGTAYCYNGQCQTTDSQCTKVFGKGAQGAPFACFEEINSPLGRLGNCGFKGSQPLPCGQKDVLCGKLACIWPHTSIYKSDVEAAVYSYIKGHVCMSITTESSVMVDGRDYTYVADGTVCGPQMYCVNKTCKKAQLVEYSCNANKKCKGNGICNNLGNCHCFPDYRPPNCEFQIGSPGGSIDDGNVQKADTVFTRSYKTHQNNWLILSFYIALPFLIIFTIMLIKRNEMRKSCNRENAEYEGNSVIVPESYDVYK